MAGAIPDGMVVRDGVGSGPAGGGASSPRTLVGEMPCYRRRAGSDPLVMIAPLGPVALSKLITNEKRSPFAILSDPPLSVGPVFTVSQTDARCLARSLQDWGWLGISAPSAIDSAA